MDILKTSTLVTIMLWALIHFTGLEKYQGETLPDINREEIGWLNYDEAREKAASDGKLMFVFMDAEWCVYCQRMHEEVFTREKVVSELKKNFHPVLVDIDSISDSLTFHGYRLSEREFAGAMEVSATPTFFFITPQEKILGHQPGFLEAGMLVNLLAYVNSDKFGVISFSEFVEEG